MRRIRAQLRDSCPNRAGSRQIYHLIDIHIFRCFVKIFQKKVSDIKSKPTQSEIKLNNQIQMCPDRDTIDLFGLYILFSHFRPRDAFMGIFLFFSINYVYICTCIRRHLKENIPSSSITWSEMGKQNIQAEEVYCAVVARAPNTTARDQCMTK